MNLSPEIVIVSGDKSTLIMRPVFGEYYRIWTDPDEPLLRGLRNRREYIKGRCRLCRFLDACGGSLRVRADLHFGDPWAPDPACYLTDEEIGLDVKKQAQLAKNGENFQMPS